MKTVEVLFRLVFGAFRPATLALLLAVGGAVGVAVWAQETGDGMPNPATYTPEESQAGVAVVDQAKQKAVQAAQDATEKAVNKVVDMVAKVESEVTKIQQTNPLAGYGKNLIAVLGATAVIVALIKSIALKGNLSQLVPDLLFPTLVIGLSVIALDKGFASSVNSTVQGLSNAFGMQPTTGSFIKVMFLAMKSMWQSHSTDNTYFPALAELAALGLQLVALIFLIVGTAFGVGVILMAKIQVAIAIALAPVMIPWLLFKPAEFLFTGWLTFLLKGGFMVVAVGAVSSIITSSLQGMSDFASAQTSGMDAVWAYGAIAVMCMLFAFLLKESASIGSGIISGGPSGIAGFGHVAGGMGGKMVTGAASTTKSIGVGTTKGLYAAGMGRAHNGKHDNQLNGFQRAVQPRQGSFQRMVYEAARGAPSNEQRQDVRKAEEKAAKSAATESKPGTSVAAAPSDNKRASGGGGAGGGGGGGAGGEPGYGDRPGPGGYSHPPRGDDTIDVQAREVTGSERQAKAGPGAREDVQDVAARDISGGSSGTGGEMGGGGA